ncbi:MAG: LysR family transcriptional regulator [Pseudomonadota bacterium]
MNLQELRTFLTIVETGSLVRASEVLNVTQSTVTARLQSLEEELGQTLLNRSKSGATMTGAGVRLHRYADTISDLWRQARQETALPDSTSGVCNLACELDLWPQLGERFFDDLQRSHPNLAVSVWLGSQTDVTAWLKDGKSDLAFTHRSASSARQDQIELPSDRLILVSTKPDSPLRFDPGYVFVEAGEAFGRDHAAAYADANTARLNFGNATVGLDHILRVGGSAYLPERLVRHHIAQARLFALKAAPDFTRRVYLTFNRSARDGWPWLDAAVDQLAVNSS